MASKEWVCISTFGGNKYHKVVWKSYKWQWKTYASSVCGTIDARKTSDFTLMAIERAENSMSFVPCKRCYKV